MILAWFIYCCILCIVCVGCVCVCVKLWCVTACVCRCKILIYIQARGEVSVLLCPSPCSHEAVSLGEPRAKLAASQPSSALSLPPQCEYHRQSQSCPAFYLGSGIQTQAFVQQALMQLSLQPKCCFLCVYQQGMINYFSKCLSDCMGVILSISVLITFHQFPGVE